VARDRSEGEVLEAVVRTKRDKAAALKLLKRIMKKYGSPDRVIIDGLRAYSAAKNEIGADDRHRVDERPAPRQPAGLFDREAETRFTLDVRALAAGPVRTSAGRSAAPTISVSAIAQIGVFGRGARLSAPITRAPRRPARACRFRTFAISAAAILRPAVW
jgi:DDE domain